MPGTILKGNLKLGADAATAVDVSDAVTQFELLLQATAVTIPQTFGSPVQETRKGPETSTLTLTYFNDDGADTVSAMLVAAFEAGTDLYFEATLAPGPVSATNEQWSGTVAPITTMKGGTAGALGQATSTLPVNSWAHTPTPTP